MSDELDFSTERIKNTGSALASSAEGFMNSVQQFQDEVSGFGEPWGSDTMGQLIGVAHQVVFEAAMKCFESNLKVLHQHANNLTQMASGYASAEDISKVEVNRVREILG